MQQALAKVGIKLTLKPYPQGDYFAHAGNPAVRRRRTTRPDRQRLGRGLERRLRLPVADRRTAGHPGDRWLVQHSASGSPRSTRCSTGPVDRPGPRESRLGRIDKKVMEQTRISRASTPSACCSRRKNLTNVFVTDAFRMYDYIGHRRGVVDRQRSARRPLGSEGEGSERPAGEPARARFEPNNVVACIIRRLLAALALFVLSASSRSRSSIWSALGRIATGDPGETVRGARRHRPTGHSSRTSLASTTRSACSTAAGSKPSSWARTTTWAGSRGLPGPLLRLFLHHAPAGLAGQSTTWVPMSYFPPSTTVFAQCRTARRTGRRSRAAPP